jgi:hypothetical protein
MAEETRLLDRDPIEELVEERRISSESADKCLGIDVHRDGEVA